MKWGWPQLRAPLSAPTNNNELLKLFIIFDYLLMNTEELLQKYDSEILNIPRLQDRRPPRSGRDLTPIRPEADAIRCLSIQKRMFSDACPLRSGRNPTPVRSKADVLRRLYAQERTQSGTDRQMSERRHSTDIKHSLR